MAKHSSFITFTVFALLLCHGSVAQFGLGGQSPWQSSHGPAQSRACRFERLDALQPQQQIQHEAGRTEYYDETNQMFWCAGVSAQRHIINPRGLLLPTYSNAPSLIYIEQGKGFTGPIFPGCPETYQSFQSQSEQLQSESLQQHLRDSHQQVHRFREGDVLALPAGVSHWCYNDGDIPVVAVQVFDISNSANQLEQREREFLLAGNKQSGQQSFVRYKQFGNNILAGFDTQLLAEALGVNQELARRLQSQHDRRGQIVHVPSGLKFIRPFRSQEQYPQQQQQQEQEYEQGEQWGRYYNASNGLDESFCHLKIRANINNPSSADVYNQQGGMISYLNNQKLPILNIVQMSAKRVILRRNAMLTPFWNVNAHSVMYVTGGQGRVQVVNNQGKTVFDGQLHRGQILIVPQNYAVLKRAHQQGFQWVSFKTNANAMVNKITGKASTFRSLPLDVISSSYRITREQAWRLKSSRREEMSIFTPLPQYHREMEYEQTERPYQYEQSAGSSQYEPEVEPSA